MKKQIFQLSLFALPLLACAQDDQTHHIVNPSFEEVQDTRIGWGTGGGAINQPYGWQFDYEQTGWADCCTKVGKSADGEACYNAWSATVLMFNLQQTISGLPAGEYELSAQLHTNTGDEGQQYIYAAVTHARGAERIYKSGMLTEAGTGNDAWQLLTTKRFKVYGGTEVVRVGVTTTGSADTHTKGWFNADDFRLMRVATFDAATVLQYWQNKASSAKTSLHAYNATQRKDALAQAESATTDEERLTAASLCEDAVAAFTAIHDKYTRMKYLCTECTAPLKKSKNKQRWAAMSQTVADANAFYAENKGGDYDPERLDAYITQLEGCMTDFGQMWVAERKMIRLRKIWRESNYAGRATFTAALTKAENRFSDSNCTPQEVLAAIDKADETMERYVLNRPSEWVTIRNGALWHDTRNKAVQAHGAGFLRVGDVYYMIGEDRSNTWDPEVNMYSSRDLKTWKFERKIISNATHETMKSRFIERPKLLYCKKTGQYVVWCHYEQSNYGASEAAVFVCDSVNGAYQYHWSGRPMGIKSRDCNVFVDNDDTAYFISTTSENTNLGLFRLSDDYLSAVEHTVLFSGQRREAPAIVSVGDTYFMLSSACSGWDPNTCKLAYSKNLKTGWSGLKSIGNPIAYDTQAAAVLTVQGTNGTSYLYVGDRWQDPNLPESKTIIFPITFNGNSCTFDYATAFDINYAIGRTRNTDDSDRYLDRKNWRIFSVSSEEDSSNAGRNAIDGNTSTIWHTRWSSPAGTAPHNIAIDMGSEQTIRGFMVVPRLDAGSTNGLIREYQWQVSTDGANWTTVSSGSWLPYGGEVEHKEVRARYINLIATAGTYASVSELYAIRGTDAPDNVNATTVSALPADYACYDLSGRRVESPRHGVFIKGNHKIMIK